MVMQIKLIVVVVVVGVVMMSPTGLMTNPIFCVDHPFLFMICHKKSNAILIIGHMLKTQSST